MLKKLNQSRPGMVDLFSAVMFFVLNGLKMFGNARKREYVERIGRMCYGPCGIMWHGMIRGDIVRACVSYEPCR